MFTNPENPSIAYFTLFTRELIDKTETPVFQTAKTDLAAVPFERVPFPLGMSRFLGLMVCMSQLSDRLVNIHSANLDRGACQRALLHSDAVVRS